MVCEVIKSDAASTALISFNSLSKYVPELRPSRPSRPVRGVQAESSSSAASITFPDIMRGATSLCALKAQEFIYALPFRFHSILSPGHSSSPSRGCREWGGGRPVGRCVYVSFKKSVFSLTGLSDLVPVLHVTV